IALRVESKALNSSGRMIGQAVAQSPQPVHLAMSTNRACLRRLTLKFPGSPEILSTSVAVRIPMLRWRPASTNFGEIIHIEQSLVGKVLSNWAITPPIAGDDSTR